MPFGGQAGLFSSGYSGYADKVFNVSWLTSVINWTGRVAAHCTLFPNYCSLRRVKQIYGQWEESSIPTITLGAGIKLTICNLNRLNAATPRQKQNQPGQSPGKSILRLSVFYLSSFPLSARFSPTLSHSPRFTLFDSYGFVSHQWPSLLSLHHTDILLGRDFHYLKSGTIYQGMGFNHLLWLSESLFLCWVAHSSIRSFFLALHTWIRPMTRVKTCSHTGPCSFTGIQSSTEEACVHVNVLFLKLYWNIQNFTLGLTAGHVSFL